MTEKTYAVTRCDYRGPVRDPEAENFAAIKNLLHHFR